MLSVFRRLAMLVFLCLAFKTAHSAERCDFPQNASVLDVRRDYGAKGNGVTDRYAPAVSIHAPARGATADRFIVARDRASFNPRSRAGSDRRYSNLFPHHG